MTGDRSRAFSPMVMLVLVLVGCVSLAGLGLHPGQWIWFVAGAAVAALTARGLSRPAS